MLADLATNATNPGMILLGVLLAAMALAVAVGRRNQARDGIDWAAAHEQAQYASWGAEVPVVSIEDFLAPPSGTTLYLVGSYRRAQWAIARAGLNPGQVKRIEWPHQLDHLDDVGLIRFAVLSDAWELPKAVEVRDRMAELSAAGAKFLLLQT